MPRDDNQRTFGMVDQSAADRAEEYAAKQVFRGPDGDTVALRDEPCADGARALLIPVLRNGRRLTGPEPSG